MRKKTTLAALFIIAALVFGLSVFVLPGCSSSDSTTNNENVIQGTVSDAGSGAKIEGVAITIGDKSTTSDSSGFYKLSGFIGGRHILKASKDGYGNYSAEVIVSSWQPTVHNIEMTGNTGETKVLGTVTDGTWKPVGIEGVTVTVGGKSTTTDSDGKYEITGIEVKNMTLTATKTAYTDYSADIDVTEGSTTTHNFVLPLAPDAELPFASTATNFTTLFPTPSPTSTVSPTSTPSPSNLPQIYLRHNYEGTTEPISLASPGVLVPGHAYDVSISANGRYTVFNYYTSINNTSLGKTRAFQDYSGIYVYDKATGTIENVSLGTSGEEINGEFHANVRRAISADGRYIVYHSSATNLVENDTNSYMDIFVYDRENITTTRISMGYSGDQINSNARNPAISADGRYVVYESDATNIVEGYSTSKMRIYRYDMQAGTTQIVSVKSDGTDADNSSYNAFASADGTCVVIQSWAKNLVSETVTSDDNVFIKNMSTGAVELISKNDAGTPGNYSSYEPTVSADGNYVTFRTLATNLGGIPTPGSEAGRSRANSQLYLRNRSAGTTTLISKNADGTPGDGDNYFACVSGDGSVVYLDSFSTNLVDNDTNSRSDSFLYYVKTGVIERFTISSDGEEGNGYSFQFAIF